MRAGGWRSARVVGAAAALASLLALAGCGSGRASSRGAAAASSATPPSYVTEPFTHQQIMVEAGARLVVTDGCSACHLSPQGTRVAPSFESLAGHRVKLRSGVSVLVDETLIRRALRAPASVLMQGYDPTGMIRAVRRAHLSAHAKQIAELAAFIEQVGPE